MVYIKYAGLHHSAATIPDPMRPVMGMVAGLAKKAHVGTAYEQIQHFIRTMTNGPGVKHGSDWNSAL
jgi:hypothetical protein